LSGFVINWAVWPRFLKWFKSAMKFSYWKDELYLKIVTCCIFLLCVRSPKNCEFIFCRSILKCKFLHAQDAMKLIFVIVCICWSNVFWLSFAHYAWWHKIQWKGTTGSPITCENTATNVAFHPAILGIDCTLL
jgi:hypothetical protein